MEKTKHAAKRILSFIVAIVMVFTLVNFSGAKAISAADPVTQPDAPATSKSLYDNGDGTYTLSLSVTGKSDTSTITNVNKANVILVIDTSSSMNNSAGSTYYTVAGTPGNPRATNTTATYYRQNGTGYSQVYYRNGNWYTSENGGTQFTGPFYSTSRFWAEYHALTDTNGIVDSLLAQNTTANPDIIEIAIASFGGEGATELDFNGNNTNANVINGVIGELTVSSGTNWEEGLIEAHNIYNTLSPTEKRDEQTYVIFLTDGQPTTNDTDHSVSNNYQQRWTDASDNARTLVETDKAEFYGIFTWGQNTYRTYVESLVGFAYTGEGQYNSGTQNHDDHFFNADSVEELVDALKQIADTITNNVGYTDTGLHDGITSMTSSTVTASTTGTVTGVKYYRSGGSYGTADPANGKYGTEWTTAPAATIGTDGVINWELGENFDLEDGVTYTMTFVVWPDQDSLDLVADLNNGIIQYSELTDDQKSQITGTAGSYTLKTNTDYPAVTYKTYTQELDEEGNPIEGTRVESEEKTSTITNPDPVGLSGTTLHAVKKWDDSLDPSQREEIEKVTLYLLVDGKYYYVDSETGKPIGVTLQPTTWTESNYINVAPGLMVTKDSPAYDATKPQVTWEGKTYAILEAGHEYVFEESQSNHHFELTAYTHHPMIMGTEIVDVIFGTDASGNTIIEDVIKLTDSLSATNTMKPGINIQKKVVDESGAELDIADPFEVTVYLTDADGNAVDTATSDDGTQYTIDYRIYYGENNPKYNNPDAGTSEEDIAKHRSGHIYKTGTSFTETLYVGDTIRVVNVALDSYYCVEETESTGYELKSTTYQISRGSATGYVDYASDAAKTINGKTSYPVEGNSASQVILTNTYTYGELDITKTVVVENGDADAAKAKEFTFTVKLYDDANKTTELTDRTYNYTVYEDGAATETTGTIKSGGTIKLKDGQTAKIEKLPEGAYYEVTEAAVTGFTTTKTGDTGTIVKNDTKTAAFTNTYSATPAKVSFPVKKIMTVPEDLEGLEDWSYTITVAANGDAPTIDTMEGTVTKAADTVTFGDFTFTKPGTYTYKVTETGTYAGVTNDTAASTGKTVTVTVTDDGAGKLSATADSTADKPLTFTNVYDADPVEVSFPVKKVLTVPEGLTGPTEWEYTIDVTAAEGTPVADVMTGTVDQDNDTVTFGAIKFTEPGTYTYTVTETGTIAGVTNDSAAATGKTVTVTVKDGGEGKLVAEVTSTTESPLTFTNTYDTGTITASFPVKKVLSVPDGLKGPAEWSYKIDVAVVDGAPEASTMTATVTQTADTATFGPFSYMKPGTYTYTVTETGTVAGVTNDAEATTGKTVTVTVEDNGDGTLTATADSTTAAPLTFTNTYDVEPTTASFPVEKELVVPAGLEGPAEWSYTIDVAAEEGTPVAETMTGTVDQDNTTVNFGDFTYTEPGTYTYTVTETGTVDGVTNDSAASTGKTVTVTVVDNGDGTLTATASSTAADPLTFTNTYGIEGTVASFPVKKVLTVPTGLTGPKTWSYTINVAAVDGAPEATEMTGTVSNTKDTVTFGEFNFTAPGTYKYTVTEKGTVAGVTNDAAASTGKTVTITVVDNGDGTLTATADSTDASPLTFTNTYDVEPTTASFPVEKILSVPTGLTGPETWSYKIDVAAVDGAPEATAMTGTVSNTVKTVTFGEFKYTAPGTYKYTVTETGTIPGVTNDADAAGKEVTVTVVDNGDGTLTATASSTAEKPLTFTNNYNVEPVKATFPVEKELVIPDGLEGPAEWSYKIDVAAVDGAPEATTMTGTVSNSVPSVTFGDFTYEAPGTYKYTVTETGTIAGVTNDSEAETGKTVTVTVTDNGDGTLTAAADSTAEKPLTFTNTYGTVPATVKFPVEKELVVPEGLTGPAEWSYKIDVAAVDGAPEATTMTGTVDQDTASVTFGDFTYTAPGTYKYTVTETGTVAGVTNDAAAATGKTVTVTVTDEGDGTLKAVADSTAAAPLTFTNTYNTDKAIVDPPVRKVLEGRDISEYEGKFTFKIEGVTAPEGVTTIPMPTNTTITNSETYLKPDTTDLYEFGEIEYTVPGTYTYNVSEVSGTLGGITYDNTIYTLTVTVTDNGDGTLSATMDPEAGAMEFINTYTVDPTTATFPVKKVLEVPEGLTGPADWSHTVTVAANGDAPKAEAMTGTVTKAAPSVTFGPFKYEAAGTYTYTVTESGTVAGVTNDTSEITVTVKVVDNGDGTLTATPDYNSESPVVFTNTYDAAGSIQLAATKQIEGREWLTDDAFTLTLIDEKGAKLGEGTATKDQPTVTFEEIKYTAEGTYTYTISEDTANLPAGVKKTGADITATVTVKDNGDGTLSATAEYTVDGKIVNTYTADPVKAKINVSKTIEGYIPGEDPYGNVVDRTFTFTMKPVDGAPMPADKTELTTTITTVGGVGTSTFDEIEYTFDDMKDSDGNQLTTKKFSYQVTETTGSDAGFTYDVSTYTVVVTVEDTQKGYLEVTDITKADEKTNVAIINQFIEEEVEVILHLQKVIDDQSNSAKDATFTFELLDSEGTVIQTKEVTTTDLEGTVDFDKLVYKAAGTYNYKIREVAPVAPAAEPEVEKAEEAAVPEETAAPAEAEAAVENTEAAADEAAEGTVEETEAVEEAAAEEPVVEEAAAEEPAAEEIYVEEAETVTEAPWTYDVTEYPVTITVNDNFETAVLEANVAFDDTATTVDMDGTLYLSITNIYKAIQTKSILEVIKEVEDTSGSAYETTFEFTLAPVDAEADPMPESGNNTVTVTYPGNTKGSFDEIIYEKAGTYNYTITETAGDAAGYIYETTSYPVVVTVEDVNGQLVATPKYGDKGETSLTVTNTYDPKDAEAAPRARKVVDDTSGSAPADAVFKFQLLDADGKEVETVTGGAGYIDFNTLTFSKVGTYKYTIKEVSESIAGFTYDTEGRDLEIVVTDPKTGSLEAAINYLTDEGEAVITNPYIPTPTSVQFSAEKQLEGMNEGVDPVTFTFTLKDEAGTELQTASVKGAGKVTFDAIDYTKIGTYTYTITEVNEAAPGYTYDTSTYVLTVEVTDLGGALDAVTTVQKITEDSEEDASDVIFVNTYAATPVTVTVDATKDLIGRELKDGEFSFTASCDNGESFTAVNDADGIITFDEFTFTKPGTYTITVTEDAGSLGGVTYDTASYKVTVTVTDNGKGKLVATTEGAEGIEFVNTYVAEPVEVELTAKKLLEGRALKDGEFTFKVYQDGNELASGTNDADGNVKFTAIKFTKAGTYNLVVKEVAGTLENVKYDTAEFKVTVVVTDDLKGKLVAKVEAEKEITFQNTYTTPPPPPVPPTGDTNNTGVWVLLMIAAGLALAVLAISRRRKNA